MRIPRSHVAPWFLISANDAALVTVKGEARILSGRGNAYEKRARAEKLSLQFDRRMETRSDFDAQHHGMMYVVPFMSVTHSAFISHRFWDDIMAG